MLSYSAYFGDPLRDMDTQSNATIMLVAELTLDSIYQPHNLS